MAINKEVYFSNGEGLSHTDLNNLQGFIRSQIFDTLGTLARLDQYTEKPNVSYCWCRGNGGAPIPADNAYYSYATGLTVHNRSGLVFQNIDTDSGNYAPTGDSPDFLAYYVAEDEWLTTLTSNSSGNPRIDIFCIKLDQLAGGAEARDFEDADTELVTTQSTNKRLNVRCQTQVVIGTPAASPTEPATPAGYVKVWSARVNNGATSLAAALVIDYRMPLGIKVVDVNPSDITGLDLGASGGTFRYSGSWTDGASYMGGRQVDVLEAGSAYFIAHAQGVTAQQRLLAVQLLSHDAGASQWVTTLVRINRNSLTTLATPTSDLLPASPGGGTTWRQSTFLTTPYWGNSYQSGHANDVDNAFGSKTTYHEIGLKCDTSAITSGFIDKVRFIFAGGF